jgi:hypothetical protein
MVPANTNVLNYGRLGEGLQHLLHEYAKNVDAVRTALQTLLGSPFCAAFADFCRRIEAERAMDASNGRPVRTAAQVFDELLATSHTLPDTANTTRGARGPQPDIVNYLRVAEIVARIAPNGVWRPKLDELCEALDRESISFPTTWKGCAGWADYDDKSKAVKAIEYRLNQARQHKNRAFEEAGWWKLL